MLSKDQLREAAHILQRGYADRTNPESEKWNPLFAGSALEFDLSDLADSINEEG